jgi:hypothetical protein
LGIGAEFFQQSLEPGVVPFKVYLDDLALIVSQLVLQLHQSFVRVR